jgi:hypothetical protein
MKKRTKCCRRRLPHIHFQNGQVMVLARSKEWKSLKGTPAAAFVCSWEL